jgi:hypothetical protein
LVKSTYDITKHSDNGKDEFTGFREFLRRVKSRNYENNLDLNYLKELWEKQNICIYTGVKLELPKKFSIYTRRIFDKYTYEDIRT